MNSGIALVGVAALALLIARRTRAAVRASASGAAPLVAPTPQDTDGPYYPGIVAFVRAASYRAGRRVPVAAIVIHINDGGDSAKNTARYFADDPEKRGASAHYVVGRQGEVYQCVSEADVAFHAHDANEYSIGIENIARTRGEQGDGDPGLPVTEANYRATALLVAYLCNKYRLERSRRTIVGHAEIDPKTSHADCPTGQWDWDHFMATLAKVQ